MIVAFDELTKREWFYDRDEKEILEIANNYSKKVKINYGFQAFQLAAFLCGKYSYDKIEEAEVPKIKKVSNMPGNIKLKYEHKV